MREAVKLHSGVEPARAEALAPLRLGLVHGVGEDLDDLLVPTLHGAHHRPHHGVVIAILSEHNKGQVSWRHSLSLSLSLSLSHSLSLTHTLSHTRMRARAHTHVCSRTRTTSQAHHQRDREGERYFGLPQRERERGQRSMVGQPVLRWVVAYIFGRRVCNQSRGNDW